MRISILLYSGRRKYFALGIIVFVLSSLIFLLISLYPQVFDHSAALSHLNYQINWQRTLPGWSSIVFVGDINSDDYSEIIVLENIVTEATRFQKIVILNSTGGLIKAFNISEYIGKAYSPHLLVQAIDIDSDGIFELIFMDKTKASSENNSTYYIIKFTCVSWLSSEVLWISELNATEIPGIFKYKTVDINEDNVLDLVILFEKLLVAIDCKTGSVMWLRSINITDVPSAELFILNTEVVVADAYVFRSYSLENGTIYWEFPILPKDINDYTHLAVEKMDVDNDGLNDIFFAISYANPTTKQTTIRIGCISVADKPNLLWNVYIPSNGFYNFQLFTIREDEVGILLETDENVYVINGKTGEILWSKRLLMFPVAMCDLDNDGVAELVGGFNTTLYYLSSLDGTILHTYSVDVDEFLSQNASGDVHVFKERSVSVDWASIEVMDINGDNHKEVIAIVTMGKMYGSTDKVSTFTIILNSKGVELSRTYVDSYIEVRSVIYEELDNDGLSEIIILAESLKLTTLLTYYLYLLKITA